MLISRALIDCWLEHSPSGWTNILHATRADLQLSYRADQHIDLIVQENRLGAADATGSFGLVGIRERVGLRGGRYNVDTAQGRGFILHGELPA